jgi:hypothetical protein
MIKKKFLIDFSTLWLGDAVTRILCEIGSQESISWLNHWLETSPVFLCPPKAMISYCKVDDYKPQSFARGYWTPSEAVASGHWLGSVTSWYMCKRIDAITWKEAILFCISLKNLKIKRKVQEASGILQIITGTVGRYLSVCSILYYSLIVYNRLFYECNVIVPIFRYKIGKFWTGKGEINTNP